MSINEEQPTPQATDRKPVWLMVIGYVEKNYIDEDDPGAARPGNTVSTVIVDMRERHEIGIKRYGVPLTSGNGRNAMIDAYQELLDFVVYCRTWLDERGIEPMHPGVVMRTQAPTEDPFLAAAERMFINMFCGAIETLMQIRGVLAAIEAQKA